MSELSIDEAIVKDIKAFTGNEAELDTVAKVE